MTTVAIDPGDKRIGVAAFAEDGSEIYRTILTPEEFMLYLNDGYTAPKRFVVESWRMTPGKTRGGSQMLSSQTIGMVKFRAYQLNVPIYYQQPDILQVAAMHEGIKLPKGHCPDDLSAFLHGSHWLIGAGLRKAVPPAVS